MERVKGKPQGVTMVDDAEAELVLLALGHALLKWKISGEPDHRRRAPYSATTNGPFATRYSLSPASIAMTWLVYYSGASEQEGEHRSDLEFDTLAAAKAACERHHATGKWE